MSYLPQYILNLLLLEVHCDFSSNTTEIVHDQASEIDIEKKQNGNDHQIRFDYQVPMSQIQALIGLSESCEQSLRFDCFLAPLMSLANDSKGSWKDKNGTQRTVFHGNLDTATQPHQCQCGLNQTCVVPELACNCDAKLPVWQADEGTITDKDLLPITEFAYGPMKYDLEQAKVTIGSLKCSGGAREEPEEEKSCPAGWSRLLSKCYQKGYGKSTFDEAVTSCRQKNAKLAEPMNSVGNVHS